MITLEKILPIIQERYPEAYYHNHFDYDDSIYYKENELYGEYSFRIIYEDFVWKLEIYNGDVFFSDKLENRFTFTNIIELKNYLDIEIKFEDLVEYVKEMIEKYECLKDFVLIKNIYQIYITTQFNEEILFQKGFDNGDIFHTGRVNDYKDKICIKSHLYSKCIFKNISFYNMYLILKIKLEEIINNNKK